MSSQFQLEGPIGDKIRFEKASFNRQTFVEILFAITKWNLPTSTDVLLLHVPLISCNSNNNVNRVL
jgi:hypothetical protein